MSKVVNIDELRVWLDARELGSLHDLLVSNDIDLEVLPELSDQDLKELGLSLGERRRLLKALREAAPPAAAPAAAYPAHRAERRQLTVMFVDLAGSTAMSVRLDPEEMGEVMRAYQNAVAGELARFDGHLAKFMGDGVLAYFGWPIAHEDDAERSLRAGLAIVGAVARLGGTLKQELAARVGIATGLVVVGDLIGDGAAREEAVVGDTPNLAARLQEIAEPGQVVVSEQTFRLTEPAFTFQDLGARELKGMGGPTTVRAVVGERAASSRFEVRSRGQVGSLFGREQELALLREHWSRTVSGQGQGVLLTGEAGIGKSRLTHALITTIEEQSHTKLRYQCSPYYRDSALWPVIQQLSFAAQFSPDDEVDTKLDKLERLLAAAPDSTDAAPLLASLLGLPAEHRYGHLDVSPQVQRTRTLTVLVQQLLALAARRPVLVIVEDAHWIDPTTLDMLQLGLDRIARRRVMMLLTSRPDGEPGLGGHPLVTRVALNRLSRAAVEAISASVAGSRWLPPSLIDEIATRADGVPLFVEELTKAVVELAGSTQEVGPRVGIASIPATLHDSLMARLDRVPEVKRVAQLAACIGREFDYRTLSSIAGLESGELESALDRLAMAELIFRRGTPPDAAYMFKHALVRDAAANSLLLSDRRRIHAALAASLQTAGSPPELIAQHAEAADLGEDAIRHWLAAGRAAAARYENVEAVSHFERALKLVLSRAAGESRDVRELEVLLALGVPQIAAHGYASAAVERTYSRARALCEQLGDREHDFFVLRGLWNCVFDRADLDQSLEIAQTLLERARKVGDREQLALAYRAVGTTLFNRGEFARSLENFRRSVESFGDLSNDNTVQVYGEAPGLISLVYSGWVSTIVGRLDTALADGERAMQLARECGHPLLIAFVAQIHCNILIEQRRATDCLAFADEALALARDHLLVFWLAGLSITSGWALAFSGDPEAGIERIRRGIDHWRATGAALHLPTWNRYLADALLLAGRHDEATGAIDEAMAIASRNGDVVVLAELHRLRARAIRRSGRAADAEAILLKACQLARAQGARLFELRAATDLARLCLERGDLYGVSQLLAPLLGTFDEGLTNPDLGEAKRLLDRASHH